MPTVVHCQDSSNARSERERSYDVHIQYLQTIKDRIRFAGPLATTDGARPRGDENLVGSLFVIDEPPSVTLELMQSDPYVKSGVWEYLSVFEAVNAYGPWASGVSLKPQGRLYATLGTAGPATVAGSAVLFGAELEPRRMWPGEPRSAIWRVVAIFSAKSLEEARSMLVKDNEDPTRQVDGWSLPITVGTWTRPV
jgi:uncharacterized protein YciI